MMSYTVLKKQGTKIKFIFEPTAQKKNFFIRKTHTSLRKLAELFPAHLTFIEVRIFRNRISFLKEIRKKQALDWFHAYVPPKSTSRIYFLSEDGSITNRIAEQILLHEMTHLYTNTVNPDLPDWIKEGISVYVAAQIFRPWISTVDWRKIAPGNVPFRHVPWRRAAQHNGYTLAGLLVMHYVRRYGWKNFIAAICDRRSMRSPIKVISRRFGDNPERCIADFKKQFVR